MQEHPGPGWTVQSTADFDADGKSDILWRSSQDGRVAIWFMNDATIAGEGIIPGTPPGLDWRIEGTGDFNGEGDILWRNQDGTMYIWYMDRAAMIGNVLISQEKPGAEWRVRGVGRFDR